MEINNLSFAYAKNEVLKDISFQVEPGDCLAIFGINGAGKSTLLKCMNRIIRPNKGHIKFNGKSLLDLPDNELAKCIGYVSQSCKFSETSVFDAVLLGRKPYIKWDVTAEDLEIVQDVLRVMSLEDFAMRNVTELSGGERQKVSIARALVQQTEVLLFDEPTSNLDLKNQLEVIQIIRDIVQERQIAAIITMHDLNLALRFANKFIMIKDGEVFAFGDKSVLTEESISHVYGVDVSICDYSGQKVVVPC
jgi:iron complex transport system ATP-binding protein